MSKVNIKQKQALVDFMEVNYKFLFGKFGSSDGKSSKEEKWKEIADELNRLGPPQKDIEKWKKTWIDMRTEVKKKYQIWRQNFNKTGAGPSTVTFSELEERISSICNKQLLDGDENISELGFSPAKIATPAKSVLREKNTIQPSKAVSDEVAGPSTRSVATTLHESPRPKRKSVPSEIDSEDSDDLQAIDSTVVPTKRLYRSQNTQVKKALELQEKQIAILERIADQNEKILKELEKLNKNYGNK